MSVPGLIEKIIRADVRAQAAYPVPDASGYVKLDAMENPYSLPEDLRAGLAARLVELETNRYPKPRADALRDTIKRVMDVPAGADILLGNGSDELIGIIAQAVAGADAKILSLTPGFVMYEAYAGFNHIPFIGVPLNADFSLNLQATLAAIAEHQPSVVYVAYPNNPTGTLYPRAAVEAILRASPGLVVVDEAYQAFAPDSFMGSIGAFDNLIVMRTVSKSGMAGVRLGYMAGAPGWINEFDKVRPPYNINVLTQCYAQFVLEHKDILDAQAALLRNGREQLLVDLATRAGVQVFPSAANFILFRVLGKDGAQADVNAATRVFDALKQRRVLIKNLSRAHPLLANCLRVTVSSPEENALFLDALDFALPFAAQAAAGAA